MLSSQTTSKLPSLTSCSTLVQISVKTLACSNLILVTQQAVGSTLASNFTQLEDLRVWEWWDSSRCSLWSILYMTSLRESRMVLVTHSLSSSWNQICPLPSISKGLSSLPTTHQVSRSQVREAVRCLRQTVLSLYQCTPSTLACVSIKFQWLDCYWTCMSHTIVTILSSLRTPCRLFSSRRA